MIGLHSVDAWEFIKSKPDKWCDVIITDPLYDAELNMDELRRICKGHIIAFCAPENPFFIPDEYAYWIKTPSTKNYSKHLGRFVEWILIERHGETYNSNLEWPNYTGVYYDTLLEKRTHKYQKPITLMERLVAIYSNKGDLVFDPFAGSGSTLMAAFNLGRLGEGCEIAPNPSREADR